MSAVLHYTAAPGPERPTEILRELAQIAPLMVVSARMLLALDNEFHSRRRSTRFLESLATRINRPIGINVPAPDGSTTWFVPPRGWSVERLQGWVAGHHEELETAYGPVDSIRKAS